MSDISAIWSELVKAAVLGTDRTELPVTVLGDLQAAGIGLEALPEEVLAKGLAYYCLLYKAARELPLYEGELPPAIEGEDSGVCSPKSSRHLRLILDGVYGEALPEFVALLQVSRKVLPPESLPALLDRCLKDDGLWQQLEPAIGRRGHWLIRQNSDWQALSPRIDPGAWPDVSTEKRRQILNYWRRTDPSRATTELERIWQELTHNEKTTLLPCLQTGLEPTDEVFLEKCLDDGRKPVRQIAAQLLILLPGSRLQDRLFEAAKEALQYDGQQFVLKPPLELPKSLERVSFEKQSPEYTRATLQQSWFLQMLERVPPRRWSAHFSLEPERIIALAGQVDRAKNLIRALAKAAWLHRDIDWLEAIARHWSVEQDEIMWTSELGRKVLNALPDESANRLAVQDLERTGRQLEERSLANQLLSLGVHTWQDQLALYIIKGFQNLLAGAQTISGNPWYYKRVLSVAAYRCSPELIPQFQTGWYTHSRIWGLWEADVEQFLRVLYFRREMKAELEK